jgi:arylsulfatase A-like enzyme
MHTNKFNRRDFLKISLLLPLLKFIHFDSSDSQTSLRSSALSTRELPNILILVFDTLSAKHVSLYGYRRDTTPNLKRFAERAAVFHRHYSAGNFTTPGTASLLTGAYPWSHRGLHLYGIVGLDFINKSIFSLLDPRYYRIAYSQNPIVVNLLNQFSGNFEHFSLSSDPGSYPFTLSNRIFPHDYSVALWGEMAYRGLDRELPSSFILTFLDKLLQTQPPEAIAEKYREEFPRGIPQTPLGYIDLEQAIEWTSHQVSKSPQPFLGYFHYYPPHGPYCTQRTYVDIFNDGWTPMRKPLHFFSEGYQENFLIEQRQYYDEYIAYTDAQFGRLYDFLQNHGLLENTIVVFTSDHGELFERGIYSHITPTLYDPLIHIPLLISSPGQRKRVDVHAVTSSVDLLPTLLHITGHHIPEWCEGKLLPTVRRDEVDSKRDIFSVEAKQNSKNGPIEKATVALLRDRYKLIHYFGYKDFEDEYELYDLENDPEERSDLYKAEINLVKRLREDLLAKIHEINQL